MKATTPRLRFTLRPLLAVVTLIGIGIGGWTHRAREQRRIVQLLGSSEGARHYYDYQFQYDAFYLPGKQSSLPPFLIDYLGTDYFHSVTMVCVESREHLDELSKLNGVQEIEINDPSVSDEDLVPITRMRSVRELTVNWPWHPRWRISDSRISDETLRRIGRMPRIVDVQIGSKHFTRIGIMALAQAPALEYAHLWGCALAGEKLPFEVRRGPQTFIVENDTNNDTYLGDPYATRLRLK